MPSERNGHTRPLVEVRVFQGGPHLARRRARQRMEV